MSAFQPCRICGQKITKRQRVARVLVGLASTPEEEWGIVHEHCFMMGVEDRDSLRESVHKTVAAIKAGVADAA